MFRGEHYIYRQNRFSKGSETILISHPEKGRQLKSECNHHGLMPLRSTYKYFLGTYDVLRPRIYAAGEEAKRKMKKETQTNLSVQKTYLW